MINCACLNLSALAFLIFCPMKQEVHTEYNTSAAHRDAMLSPGKPLVLLFESWVELAAFLMKYFYLNQLKAGCLSDIFSEMNEVSCYFKENKWLQVVPQW